MRYPNFLSFLVTGAVLGVAAGLIVSAATHAVGGDLFYLAVVGALVGLALGGLLAWVLDVIADRRHKKEPPESASEKSVRH